MEVGASQRRWGRGFGRLACAAAALGLVAAAVLGLWLRSQLLGSLPQLDGTATLNGLSAPVVVTRDLLGVPTIAGATREDVARATGYLHGQERFFQMDLSRRRSAGELAALVGEAALDADRGIRVHRFRHVALDTLARLSPRDRHLLDAYTAGVNDGLGALETPPFEYLLLRQRPEAWRPEDTMLVVLSMFVLLQDERGAYETTLGTMRDVLPPEMFEFLAPLGTEWDAPVAGEALRAAAIPGPAVYDLRARRRGRPGIDLARRARAGAGAAAGAPDGTRARLATSLGATPSLEGLLDTGLETMGAIGSNSWVVSGAHTVDGRPLVANDAHLTVRVPNTWFRAVLTWPDPDPDDPSRRRRLAGLTLPGVPALVIGSNGDVAWGFTNTYADWSDVVLLDVDPERPDWYRTPDGWRRFEPHREVIEIAGQAPTEVVVPWTVWGPVIEPDHLGRPRAYRWVAHGPDRLVASLTPLEEVRTVEEAFDSANGLNAPGQNLVAADRDGTIGWSVYGAIPRRSGLDGRLPSSWADGARGWNGWLAPHEYPRIVNPSSGRLWTANARVVGGDMLAVLGDGSYEVGARATIIRDRLMAQDRFTMADMLALQLDTSSRFLGRWRDLVLDTLTPDARAGHEARGVLRTIVDGAWPDRALPESAAYRLVHAFRDAVSERVIRFVLAECYEADPDFDYTSIRKREGPIWALVTGQPRHLLDPRFDSWHALLLDAVDQVIEDSGGSAGALHGRVWSDDNVALYRHPLSPSLPLAGRWLDLPVQPLPGDLFTPRMHWGAAAASMRFLVSPGREEEGMMQTPVGQSGHPLSPFYASSHEAWATGTPTPLLAGPTVHTLTLMPGK